MGTIHCERIVFVDGDYDDTGRYWGNTDRLGIFLYCVSDENATQHYRAKSPQEAIGEFVCEFHATDIT